MNLQPPQQTDLIANLQARVTALEGASYDSNSPVDMFKLFSETPYAQDSFTISTHAYHLCSTSLDVQADDYLQLILSDTPVAYYRLDETKGNTAHDRSGNGLNGTINGGVTLNQPGALQDRDPAMSFDGSTGSVIIPIPVTAVSNVSLECWINLNNSTSAHGAFIKIGNGSSGFGIGIGSMAGSWDNPGNYLLGLFEIMRWIVPANNPTIPAIGWHHAAFILDASGIPNFYLDGEYLGSTSGSGAITPTGVAQIAGDDSASTRFFAGLIDEVAIYNYALSASQVQAHYSAGSAVPLLFV